jgi:hypothetical protein
MHGIRNESLRGIAIPKILCIVCILVEKLFQTPIHPMYRIRNESPRRLLLLVALRP